MDFVIKKLLERASSWDWFEKQDNSCLEIWTYAVSVSFANISGESNRK